MFDMFRIYERSSSILQLRDDICIHLYVEESCEVFLPNFVSNINRDLPFKNVVDKQLLRKNDANFSNSKKVV